MKISTYDSLVYRALIRCYRRIRHTSLEPIWWKIYNRFLKRGRQIRATIHNQPVVMKFDYQYPIVVRNHPTFNGPLLELINITHRVKNRKLRFADVGVAIGDTVLLVEANCPNMVEEYVCLDGEKEWFPYLEHNLALIRSKKLICAQLSRTGGRHSPLVKIRPDVTCASGEGKVDTASLDQVLNQNAIGPIDVLKIDVEGYDGEVILGSASRLKSDMPNLIFEWHPIMCRETKTTYVEHFSLLNKLGYDSLAWFDKLGNFSHFSESNDIQSIERLAEYCVTTKNRPDWHYDVIALAPGSESAWREAAELNFSRNRRSWF